MKRQIAILALALLALGITACGNEGDSSVNEDAQTITAESSEETVTDDVNEQAVQDEVARNLSDTSEASDVTTGAALEEGTNTTQTNSNVLVVYFSATGTTKGVAEKIAAVTGADTYEIKAAQEYTDDDLNWNDSNSRTTKEQNDSSVRPEIGSDEVSLDGYTTIYIGYPIWWGEEPRIMDTFVESYSFEGITMIPFCTSGGSGIGRSGQNLADNAGSGTWIDGQRFSAGSSEDDIRTWIDSIQ